MRKVIIQQAVLLHLVTSPDGSIQLLVSIIPIINISLHFIFRWITVRLQLIFGSMLPISVVVGIFPLEDKVKRPALANVCSSMFIIKNSISDFMHLTQLVRSIFRLINGIILHLFMIIPHKYKVYIWTECWMEIQQELPFEQQQVISPLVEVKLEEVQVHTYTILVISIVIQLVLEQKLPVKFFLMLYLLVILPSILLHNSMILVRISYRLLTMVPH